MIFFFLEIENRKSDASSSLTTSCRRKTFWPRSCSIQLIYSVYQRQNIHYIICPSHWAEGKGHSWQDCAQLKGLETVHLQFLWIAGWHPQSTLACAAFRLYSLPCYSKCYLHFKTIFISLFFHEGFFFLIFRNHIQSQFLFCLCLSTTFVCS